MAVNPAHSINFSMVDRSGEPTGFSVNLDAPFDTVDTSTNTGYADFLTALGTISDGIILRLNASSSRKLSNAAYAGAGQREEKWLCTYSDVTTLAIYALEIPCRKQSGTGILPPVGQDAVDLSASVWALFKTAFEAFVKSPDQNDVNLLEVRLVGRNN